MITKCSVTPRVTQSTLPHAGVSEKSTEAHLVRRAAELGGVAVKFTGCAGWPDRLVLMPGGRVAFCELKSKGCRPRRLQEVTIERIRALGVRVWVCDDRAQVEQMLKEI